MSGLAWYLQAIIMLAIVGVIVWIVTSIPQIPQIFRTIIIALSIIFALLWVMRDLIPRIAG